MPEIATLAARIAITGAQEAKAGLRDMREEMTQSAAVGETMAKVQATLGERIAAATAQSVGEVNSIKVKESSIAAMAARYVEASAALQEWIKQNGNANVQALEQQANLDRLAFSIQKEALALYELKNASAEDALAKTGAAAKGVADGIDGITGATRRITDEISGLFGQLSGIFDLGGIGGMLMAGGGVAAIAAAGKAVIDLGNQTATSIAQIVNYAERAGMSSANFARLAEAADDASISARGLGVEYAQVGSALENFQNQIGRGQLALDGFNVKGGASRAAFEALGVQLQDSSGKSREMTDILLDTADAMQKMGDGAERTALAKRLGLYDLLPLLEKGRNGVREMMGAVDDSLVPTAEAEKAAIRLQAAEDNLNDSLRGIKTTIGTEIIPILSELTEKFNDQLKTSVSGFEALGNMFSSVGKGQDNYNRSVYDMVKALEGSTLIGNVWYRELLRGTSAYQSAARAAEESASAIQGWADAYSEGVGRVSSATSALPKNEMGDWAAAWEDAAARVDKSITYISDDGKAKLKELKAEWDNLTAGLRTGLPTPGAKNRNNLFSELMGIDPKDEDYAKKVAEAKKSMETSLVGEMGKSALDFGVDQGVVKDIFDTWRKGAIDASEAIQLFAATTPKLKNIAPQAVSDLQQVETLFGGNRLDLDVRKTSSLVRASDKELEIYKENTEKKKRAIEADERLMRSYLDPNNRVQMGASWAGAEGEAKYQKEHATNQKAIQEAEKENAAIEAKMKGKVWTTLFSFDEKNMPKNVDEVKRWLERAYLPELNGYLAENITNPKLPSKGMEAHHDKFDEGMADGSAKAKKFDEYFSSIKPGMEQSAKLNVGNSVKQGIVAGITDGSSAIKTAVQDAVLPAYGYMKSPESLAMWNSVGSDMARIVADGVRQDAWRITDAYKQASTGIREALIRDVIERLMDK